jgi:hypothetical protein
VDADDRVPSQAPFTGSMKASSANLGEHGKRRLARMLIAE